MGGICFWGFILVPVLFILFISMFATEGSE
jgi:hypothetical protein